MNLFMCVVPHENKKLFARPVYVLQVCLCNLGSSTYWQSSILRVPTGVACRKFKEDIPRDKLSQKGQPTREYLERWWGVQARCGAEFNLPDL